MKFSTEGGRVRADRELLPINMYHDQVQIRTTVLLNRLDERPGGDVSLRGREKKQRRKGVHWIKPDLKVQG
jgi:hypothetical protein